MRYTYAYRTSEGTRLVGDIEAESRDAAFEALRVQGIRPIKVEAADGSKANGEVVVRGVSKRIVALAVVVASSLAAILSGLFSYKAGETISKTEISPRRWIATGNADFKHESERMLAMFARPGVEMDESFDFDPGIVADLKEALSEPVAILDSDDEEAAELKRMVEGLKQEMKTHLRGGNDYEGIIRFFIQRQKMEAALRSQIIESVKNASPSEKQMRLSEANEMLSTLGFELIE